MKRFCYIILMSMAFLPVLAFTRLDRSRNSFRAGDHLTMTQISLPDGCVLKDTSVYDFSECHIGKEYEIKYTSYNDSLTACCENRSVTILDARQDTVKVLSYRKPGLSMNYLLPEIQNVYPLSAGQSFNGYFYMEGRDGTIGYARHCGKYNIKAKSQCTIVTPDGDTVHRVMLIEHFRAGSTLLHDINDSSESSCLSDSLIESKATSDSITHSIARYSWYAEGYRYPVIDIRQYKIYYYGTAIDSVTTALYYRLADQEFGILNDPENENIRQLLQEREIMVTESRSVSDQSHDSGNSVSERFSQSSTCTLSPTIVTETATLTYSTEVPASVTAGLYSASGALLWEKSITTTEPHGSIVISVSELPCGEYIVMARLQEETYPFKIIKE